MSHNSANSPPDLGTTQEIARAITSLDECIEGIRELLRGSVDDLQREGQTARLRSALENLHLAFGLLDRVTQQLHVMPEAVATLDAAVSRAMQTLHEKLSGEVEPLDVAAAIESQMLPALSNWDGCRQVLATSCANALEAML